jgi:hypothetical protein
MPEFDLAKTHELADLLFVEREQRDADWIRRFYDAVADASMATSHDQILQGPDGFSYFVLNMPPPRREVEPFSVSRVLDFCLENSLGIAIEPEPGPPEWVFPFGQLWSKKEFGKFDLNLEPQPGSELPEMPAPEKPSHLEGKPAVLVGQPSTIYFPGYARKAVKQFLLRQGVTNPSVLMVSNPRQHPAETIAFSVFAEDLADQDRFRNFMQHLAWFFPPHYRLSSINKSSEIARNFQPL